jgi:hypothetical protein
MQPVNYFQPNTVALVGGGKTAKLESPQPAYGLAGTDGKELDLEVIFVGQGSEADLIGQDLRGKAVLYGKELRNHHSLALDVRHGVGLSSGEDDPVALS